MLGLWIGLQTFLIFWRVFLLFQVLKSFKILPLSQDFNTFSLYIKISIYFPPLSFSRSYFPCERVWDKNQKGPKANENIFMIRQTTNMVPSRIFCLLKIIYSLLCDIAWPSLSFSLRVVSSYNDDFLTHSSCANLKIPFHEFYVREGCVWEFHTPHHVAAS